MDRENGFVGVVVEREGRRVVCNGIGTYLGWTSILDIYIFLLMRSAGRRRRKKW